MTRRPAAAVVAALSGALVLAGCGAAPSGGAAPAGEEGAVITVFAAASLTDTFTRLGRDFEASHPGTTVRFSFGGSSALATQIAQGAPADVFAPAATAAMDGVVAAGAATGPRTFARNTMEIAVPPANPARIAALADLARPGVKVAVCQPTVPCGAAARTVFSRAGIEVTPVTLEADVKATLAKVRLGEVDAGVVYVTDVRAAGDAVRGVSVPAAQNATTDYPIAALTASRRPDLARAFVEYVLSAPGRSVLAGAGFQAP